MKVVYTGKMRYKRDSKGKVRIWLYEVGSDGTKWGWRTTAGLQDGKKVTSEWTITEPKNVGRSNEMSAEQQAYAEAEADEAKKLERGYFAELTNVDTFDKFNPMLAQKYEDYATKIKDQIKFSQPKLDGIRCIARSDGLWTRTGKKITSVPHVWREVKKLFKVYGDKAIFDGELYNHDLRDNFNEITSIVRKQNTTAFDDARSEELIQYHMYDMLRHYGDSRSFVDRQSDLNALPDVIENHDVLRIVETVVCWTQEQLDNLNAEYVSEGYEGQMVRLDAPYENKRTSSLLKRKEFITEEFKVAGILEGNGNWSGCVKHLILLDNKGGSFKSGIRGSKDKLRKMWQDVDTPSWATIRYFQLTPDGVPRFPIAVDWGKGERDD